MKGSGHEPEVTAFALHGDQPAGPVLRRLVGRGLHDDLKGTAFAIVEGVDERTHDLLFADLDMTGDAKPGAIVEASTYQDQSGRHRLSLAKRSDRTIEAEMNARGATWMERQLLAADAPTSLGGFGTE
jgi:hypothetical protein